MSHRYSKRGDVMKTNNLYWDTNNGDELFRRKEGVDSKRATEEDVLINLGFRDPFSREIKVGKMPMNEALDVVLEYGELYTIPKGYHSGLGTVRTQELSLGQLTPGTAIDEDIAENKVAWVNGIRVVGKLKINKNNMEGTATENDIVVGKDAWVNGKHIYGKMPVILREDTVLYAGDFYKIPRGYHGGEAIVHAADLAIQTPATAGPQDIVAGKSAWVKGKLIVGELEPLSVTLSVATASISDIRKSKTAFIANGLVTGTMNEYLNRPQTLLTAGQTFDIPVGYHDGMWRIKADSLYNQTQASATSADIRKNKTAWVNGALVYGEMEQEISPNSPGTAEEKDLKKGKIAWSNGVKLIGTNEYDSISYAFNENNSDDPSSPIVCIMPTHRWNSINTLIIEFFDVNDPNRRVQKVVYSDVVSGSSRIKGTHSVVTTLGSPRVVVTNFDPNYYIEVSIYGYDVVDFSEENEEVR